MKLFNNLNEVIFESELNNLAEALSEAKEKGISLTNLKLVSVNLSSIDLSGLDLSGIKIIRSNISNVNFESSILVDGEILQSNVRECNLSKCDVKGLVVTKSNVTNCDGMDLINYTDLINNTSNISIFLTEEDKIAKMKEEEERNMHHLPESENQETE